MFEFFLKAFAILLRQSCQKGSLVLILYLVVWFTFGYSFYSIANDSYGQEFIFPDDIKKNIIINRVFKELNLRLSNHAEEEVLRVSIDNLLSSRETDDPKKRNYQFENFTVEIYKINYDWAFVSLILLKNEGITHISLKNYRLIDKTKNLYEYKISLWNLNQHVNGKQQPTSNYHELIRNIVVLTDKKYPLLDMGQQYISIDNFSPFGSFLEGSESNVLERIAGLHNIPFYIQKNRPIYNSSGLYNTGELTLTDFLYFSAITITTLGYGDILPKSYRVRALVMVETLLGVILAGVFIYFLTTKNKKATSLNLWNTRKYYISRNNVSKLIYTSLKLIFLLCSLMFWAFLYLGLADSISVGLSNIIPNNFATKLLLADGYINHFKNPNDTSAVKPVSVTILPDNSNISPNQPILIWGYARTGGIHHIGYYWDPGAYTVPVYDNQAKIQTPEATGAHTVNYYAKDASSKYNSTKWYHHEYYIDEKTTLVGTDLISYPFVTLIYLMGIMYIKNYSLKEEEKTYKNQELA